MHRKQFSTSTSPTLDLKQLGNVLGGENILPENRKTFIAWHQALNDMRKAREEKSNDTDIIAKRLSLHVDDKCTFHPPTYFKAWEGREEFLILIESASEVFGESFVYEREFISPDGKNWALEFSATIGNSNKVLKGIDLVELNDEGKIQNFIVLARPPNAVEELKKEMMKRVPIKIAKLKAKQFFNL